MGLDPATASMIGMLGGPALAGLFGPDVPEGQELKSFDKAGQLSPVNMLNDSRNLLLNLAGGVGARAAAPISLPSAYVQQPIAYTGGGLPFPIGMGAQDPALTDRSLLTRPGMTEFENLFKGVNTSVAFPSTGVPTGPGPGTGTTPGGGIQPGDTFIPGSNIDPDGPLGGDAELGNAFDNFFLPPFDQRTEQNPNGTTDGAEPSPRNQAESRSGPRRPGVGLRASDILDDANPVGGDDLDRAHGAAKLLLEALGSGDAQGMFANL